MSQKETMKNIIGGACAGTLEAIITWPTENIKTQMQFKGQSQSFKETTLKIYQDGGISSFYRGLSPVLIFNIPKVILRFYSYDLMSNQLTNMNKNVSTILSGLFAGFVESTLVTVPSETIKTKFIKNQQLRTIDIVKKEGFKGLYQGYFPTLGRQSLNQASRFYFYNNYKQMIEKTSKFSSFHSFLGGVGAGCFSVLISTPMDVLKTQMQEGNKESMLKLSKNILRSHGVFGFWRGSIARLMRVAPGQGVMFLTYDFVSKYFDKIKK